MQLPASRSNILAINGAIVAIAVELSVLTILLAAQLQHSNSSTVIVAQCPITHFMTVPNYPILCNVMGSYAHWGTVGGTQLQR